MRIENYNSDIGLEEMETLQIVIKAVPFEKSYAPAFVMMSPEEEYPMSLDELNCLMDGVEIAKNKIDEIINYVLRKKIFTQTEDGNLGLMDEPDDDEESI